MKELVRCSAARDDFRQWLDTGKAPITACRGKKADMMFLKLKKGPSVDYLYQIPLGQDNAISWDNSLTFCGVYDVERQTLYLTGDAGHFLMSGGFIAEVGSSVIKIIGSRINQRVEDIIANDRNNLPVQEVRNIWELRNLQYYREYGAKEEAIRQFLSGKEPACQFRSGYEWKELSEAAFMAYLQDPEGFIQREAEQYIKTHQEEILVHFLEDDALLAEYQALIEDAGNPVHRMKAITEAVKASGAKTVTVTVQKDGQELTFKAAASSLTGHRTYYSSYDIPAPDRREFERLFGRCLNYTAEDITRISYGRNTIYEAPPAPSEEQELGGMSLGF